MNKNNLPSILLGLALTISISYNLYQSWQIDDYKAEIMEREMRQYESELTILKAVCDTIQHDSTFCGPKPLMP